MWIFTGAAAFYGFIAVHEYGHALGGPPHRHPLRPRRRPTGRVAGPRRPQIRRPVAQPRHSRIPEHLPTTRPRTPVARAIHRRRIRVTDNRDGSPLRDECPSRRRRHRPPPRANLDRCKRALSPRRPPRNDRRPDPRRRHVIAAAPHPQNRHRHTRQPNRLPPRKRILHDLTH